MGGARVYGWRPGPGLAIRQGVSRVLSDERQILNLLYSYCELQDAADFAGVAELFRHSGYRVHNGEEHFGYDEVHALKTAHDKVYDDRRSGPSTSRPTRSSNSIPTARRPAHAPISRCTRRRRSSPFSASSPGATTTCWRRWTAPGGSAIGTSSGISSGT